MGVPIVSPVVDAPSIASVTGGVVEVPLIGKGFLTRLSVQEVGGVHAGFDVYVYDRATVYNADGSNGADVANEQVLRVLPKQTVAASGELLVWFDPSGAPFVNKDGTLSNNIRKIYVRIVPAGTGNKVYKITAAGTSVTA